MSIRRCVVLAAWLAVQIYVSASPALQNKRPVADAGPDQTVVPGSAVILRGSRSSDPGGQPLGFQWTLTEAPAGSSAVLTNSNSVSPTFIADQPGSYTITLTINNGTHSSAADSIVVSTLNSAPLAHAGNDQTAYPGSVVRLSGAKSTDVDGNLLTFAWSVISQPSGSSARLSDPRAVMPTFPVDIQGDFVLQLIVNDGIADSAPATVRITTDNSAPISSAGPDQTMAVGSAVQLNGTTSSDPERSSLSFNWSLITRPAGSTSTLFDATSATPGFTVDQPGTYVAQLIVNDGLVSSVADTVTIDTYGVPPVADAGVDQEIALGASVTADGSASFDADGQPLAYSWSVISRPVGSTSELVNAETVSPTLVPDQAGIYVLQLITKDGILGSSPDTVVLIAKSEKPTADAEAETTVQEERSTTIALDEGTLANGFLHTGSITGPGEVDTWTFTANAGDRIAVHIGEIVDNNDFRPWIKLKAPNGASLGEASGVAAAQVGDVIAPATGTYTVEVASFDSGFDGTGTYRLTMTHTPGPLAVASGDQGGPLLNGAIHTGGIIPGDLDVWAFSANAGERIAVHIGETLDRGDFRPWIRLWAPNGATLGSASGLAAAQIGDVIAPVTGRYLVLVASFDSGYDGTGTYRLNMVKTPGPITVSDQDQGGPITNGGLHTGEILPGDVDVWTFPATAGQRIGVHIGEVTEANDFRPWIRVWAPNGATLGSASGLGAAQIGDVIAPISGTYLILVSSFDSDYDGSGTYRLSLVKTTGAITVSEGDQGGPITNGSIHTGEILRGDLDVWTFTANAGDRIAVHIGEITDTDDFRPWIRVWAPNNATLGSASGLGAAQIGDVIAPMTGRYLVVVSTFDSGYDGTGTYRLNTVRTPGPITLAGNDQGGPITNGELATGEILRGDIDVWTFNAAAGQRLAVHVGEITDNDDFRPWIRLWAPNGATLGSASGLDAAQIGDVIAPTTGLYLVVVSTFDSGYDGAGTYRLNIAKTVTALTVSPGDQGGPLPLDAARNGDILQGDIDVWSFNATAGQRITVQITQTGETDDFRPWIRLWDPNSGTLGSVSGLTSAQIGQVVAPASGRYLIVVGTFDSGYDGTGTYQLTANVVSGP